MRRFERYRSIFADFAPAIFFGYRGTARDTRRRFRVSFDDSRCGAGVDNTSSYRLADRDGTASAQIPFGNTCRYLRCCPYRLISLPLGADQAMLDPHDIQHAVELESRRLDL